MPKRRAENLDEQENKTSPLRSSKRLHRGQPSDPVTPSKGTSAKKKPADTLLNPTKTVQIVEDAAPSTGQATPRSGRKSMKTTSQTHTPTTNRHEQNVALIRNADRSARKKSSRKIIEQAIAGIASEDEEGDDDNLAQRIWQDSEDEEEAASSNDEDGRQKEGQAINQTETAITPQRGRPKGRKRKRTPTPPSDLPPHERYFFENRPKAAKSSSNILSSADVPSHASYHKVISSYEDRHADSIENLHEHYESQFPLWAFELSQQFSICLYGYGSKRRVLASFADYLYSESSEQEPTIIIINGHHQTLSLKTLLQTLAGAVFPSSAMSKLPTQPAALTAKILSQLTSDPPPSPIYMLISTIHTKPLVAPAALTTLSQLASHPSIHLLATMDNPSYPLVLRSNLRATFNFVFHDATTFIPYDTGSAGSELSTVVDSVTEMLGRKEGVAAGREGVKWVLKSLPENARGLYRILVEELLTAADVEGDASLTFEAEEEQALGRDLDPSGADNEGVKTGGMSGIDAKVLYRKAAEAFLCSSEMMFWSLLKEFIDHRMIFVRRGRGLGGGGEMLGIGLGREELEGILEDLME